MPTVNQPGKNPTRKLAASVLGASAAAIVKAYITNKYPYFGDPVIWEPFPIVCGAICGWFIKDQPNIVVITPEDKS